MPRPVHEDLPRLHRASIGWQLHDSALLLARFIRQDGWQLHATHITDASRVSAWTDLHGLTDARFDTLIQARRTLGALIATDPPPRPSHTPVALRRVGRGEHHSTDGRFRVRWHPGLRLWLITDMVTGEEFGDRLTLRRAGMLIAERTVVQT